MEQYSNITGRKYNTNKAERGHVKTFCSVKCKKLSRCEPYSLRLSMPSYCGSGHRSWTMFELLALLIYAHGYVYVNINFQPPKMTVPSGYVADSGALFGPRGTDFQYGWSCDLQSVGSYRDRENQGTIASSIVVLDRNGDCKGEVTWQIALPNGAYNVIVGYSDRDYGVDTTGCKLQGLSASLGSVPKGYVKEFVMQAQVTNGKLSFQGKYGTTPQCASIAYMHIQSSGYVNVNINFQPPQMAVPGGYIPDSGALFGSHGTDKQYGWSCDLQSFGDYRDRENQGTIASSLVVLDRNGYCMGEVTWQIALPNGTYNVIVGYSDRDYTSDTTGCKLQGLSASLGSVPQDTVKEFFTAKAQVTNGKLSFQGKYGATPGCSIISYMHIQSSGQQSSSARAGETHATDVQVHEMRGEGEASALRGRETIGEEDGTELA
eukprot:g24914.t1